MPPKKVPKEVVQYPASKRKAPPFKPQRPSQRPRVDDATGSEASSRDVSRTSSANIPVRRTATPGVPRSTSGNGIGTGTGFASAGSGMFARPSAVMNPAKRVVLDEDDEEEEVGATAGAKAGTDEEEDDDSDELDDNPLTKRPTKPHPAAAVKKKPAASAKRKPSLLDISDDDEDVAPPAAKKNKPTAPPRRQVSPLDISDDDEEAPQRPLDPDPEDPPIPSQSPSIPSIPRPLLLRLMHEHFASKGTKIDKHAVTVLEKYFEVFIREVIARAALAKKEDVQMGNASQADEKWLEKGDLEKVVAGVVLDF